MNRFRPILIALLLVALSVGAASAAGRPLGLRAGYSLDPNQITIGLHTRLDKPTPEIRLYPNMEIGFGDDITLFSVGLAGRYRIYNHELHGYEPYLGLEAGFNSLHYSDDHGGGSDGKAVVSLLGGLQKTLSLERRIFFEMKLGLSDYAPDVKLIAGMTLF